MELSEKLADFLEGWQKSRFHHVSSTKVGQRLHRSTSKGGGYLFEENSRLESPWIVTDRNLEYAGFIGAHSYINDGGYIRGAVFIGRYCSIGRRVTIGAGQHLLQGLSTSPYLHGARHRPYSETEKLSVRPVKARPPRTVICSDVWIGDGAVVLPGVTIAEGAVVGANAVVTKSVSPYQIVTGIPARPIGRRFSEDLCNQVLMTRWWEYPLMDLRALPTQNVFEFLEKASSVLARPIVPLETYYNAGKRKGLNQLISCITKSWR